MALELQISVQMVQEVLDEFEREHPGLSADGMSSTEFADRMMKKNHEIGAGTARRQCITR